MGRTAAKREEPQEDIRGVEMHRVSMHAIGALNPAPYNPRKITPQMLQALKDNIRAHGFLEPVVVQKKGMTLIAGHQRIRALKEICVEDEVAMPTVPCVVVDVDDRTAKKLNVTLNRVGGEFDDRLLGELLTDMHHGFSLVSDELLQMGIAPDDAVLKLVPGLLPPPMSQPPMGGVDEGSGMKLLTTCPKCGHEFKPSGSGPGRASPSKS
jgi:hypothetical protein